jgi:hypothetical protein
MYLYIFLIHNVHPICMLLHEAMERSPAYESAQQLLLSSLIEVIKNKLEKES